MPLRAVLNKSFIVESYSILHLKNEMHHLIRQSSVAHILSFVIAMIETIGVDIEWSMTRDYSSLGHPPLVLPICAGVPPIMLSVHIVTCASNVNTFLPYILECVDL